MKHFFIVILFLSPLFMCSQELKLSFLENLNRLDLLAIKEILVDGHGYYLIEENKYLHPKSVDETHAFMLKVKEDYIPSINKTGRLMEIICSEDLNINNFKSELIQNGYEYVGKPDLKSLDVLAYKKGSDNEVYIGDIGRNGVVKYQITFFTRY